MNWSSTTYQLQKKANADETAKRYFEAGTRRSDTNPRKALLSNAQRKTVRKTGYTKEQKMPEGEQKRAKPFEGGTRGKRIDKTDVLGQKHPSSFAISVCEWGGNLASF